jgi:hypothetical protein
MLNARSSKYDIHTANSVPFRDGDDAQNQANATRFTVMELPQMFHRRPVNKALMLSLMLVYSGTGLANGNKVDHDAPPMTAAWHLQRIEFNYRSTNIYYSCEGLRNKLVKIMTAIGAREDVRVDIRCRSGAVMNNAETMITVATPVEATPENVAALTTYSTEAQLAARLNTVKLPSANDIERFSAEWRTVELNRIRGAKLEAGDCDLLEGLIDQVFPHLPVRILKQRTSCSMGGRLGPTLHVAALKAAPVIPLAFAPTE